MNRLSAYANHEDQTPYFNLFPTPLVPILIKEFKQNFWIVLFLVYTSRNLPLIVGTAAVVLEPELVHAPEPGSEI